MTKILFTAFNGKTNSSKLLLDKINATNKLYLKNSFTSSVSELESELENNHYDLVISFGQLRLKRDTIQIEEGAMLDKEYKTNYDYSNIKSELEDCGYKVRISRFNSYLCNNLYYHGLKYIDDNNLKTKMIFIHIPKIKNITNIDTLANSFSKDKF